MNRETMELAGLNDTPSECEWLKTNRKVKPAIPGNASETVVQTSGGFVRGCREDTKYGSSFYMFQHIPYAKPPLGQLRFLPPVQPEPWTGVLDGTSSAVPETEREIPWHWGSEDCLYLHVRTKTFDPNKKKPVMVWFGGVGFCVDISLKLGSGLLTDEDIIFVNVSYRVGVFGFLSVGEITAAGNCGLKDIVMALQWVQENIAEFGGDPDNVTIFGSGSGGSMVHYMMLSPMATGLFHKAIIQSGCALHNWAVSKNPAASTMCFAKKLGITKKDPVEVVEVLRTLPEIDILSAFFDLINTRAKLDGFPLYSIFRPCIENEFEGQPAFITKSPFAIIRSGKFTKVPFIIGSNKQEGFIFKKYVEHRLKEPLSSRYDSFTKNLQMLIPGELCVESESAKSKNVGLRLMQFYISGDTVKEETSDEYFQFLSDYHFLYYINKSVKLHSQSTECPIYYYVFDYNGHWAIPELRFFNAPTHAGELPYLFQMNSLKYEGNRDSLRTRQRVIKLWTNFAKFGHPTPTENDELLQVTWDPVTDENKLLFLNIGSELTKGCNPFNDRMTFWDTLLDETTYLRICAFFDELVLKN